MLFLTILNGCPNAWLYGEKCVFVCKLRGTWYVYIGVLLLFINLLGWAKLNLGLTTLNLVFWTILNVCQNEWTYKGTHVCVCKLHRKLMCVDCPVLCLNLLVPTTLSLVLTRLSRVFVSGQAWMVADMHGPIFKTCVLCAKYTEFNVFTLVFWYAP